jgi:hypothetical protein
VLPTLVWSRNELLSTHEVDVTDGTVRGENLAVAGFSLSIEVKESVLIIMSSMSIPDVHRSLE